MNRIYRIALYLRLSKEDEEIQDESNSIRSQRCLLKDYVRKNFAHYEVYEFVDDGYSGTNFRRPGIQELLGKIQDRSVDCVIVKDFSRFSRDYIELGSYLEQIFPFLGIRFISLNDHYDSRDYAGKAGDLNTSFKGLMYDLYSKDLSLKVKSSLQIRKAKGQYCSGNTPFGYGKNPNDRHQLVIAQDEAQVVRRIFALALEGKTSVEISRVLNQEQISTPTQFRARNKKTSASPGGRKAQWEHTAICAILRNPVYAGDMVYNKYYRTEVGGRNHLKPRSEWEVCKEHHAGIISRKAFEKVQKLRNPKGKKKKKTHKEESIMSTHTLQGKVLCSSQEMSADGGADVRKKIENLQKKRRELERRKTVLLRKRMEDYEKSVYDTSFEFQKDGAQMKQIQDMIHETDHAIEKLKAEISTDCGKSAKTFGKADR